MNRRSTYLLLLILLFAKSYASALPVTQPSFSTNAFEKIRQHHLHNAAEKEAAPSNISLADDDNEEDDDYAPVLKQAVFSNSTFVNNLFARGFLIHRFKNAGDRINFHSSYPPVYLHLRVIRI